MTNVVINGQNFETNSLSDSVDYLQLILTDGPAGSYVDLINVAGPGKTGLGPNDPSIVINEWSNTQIDFDHELFPELYVSEVQLYGEIAGSMVTFAVTPNQPQDTPPATVTSITATGNDGEVEVTGTNLDFNNGVLGTIRLYYSPGGPYIQWDGWTATGGGTSVILSSPVLIGKTVDSIELFDDVIQTNSLLSDAGVPDLPLFLPAAQPIVTAVTQTGPDEITVAGDFFTTASDGAVDHIIVDGSFGSLAFCHPGSPSFPGCLPMGAGVGPLNETSFAVSAPDLIGATIEQVRVEDFGSSYTVVFDVDPDLTLT